MVESPPSSTPDGAPPGLSIEAVEWLPSGAESGLLRVRGHWAAPDQAPAGLPLLIVGSERFESLPDARSLREPGSWRGSYLVPATLMGASLEALSVEWASGARAALPLPARDVEPVAAPVVPPDAGGEVIDRAVLAERRAARAEAAEQAQARAAAEALRAVEALELRSAELERRVAEAGGSPEQVAALESRLAGERAVHAEVREELQRRLEGEQEARAAAEAAVVSAREELTAALESAQAAAAGAREAADAIAARVLELESALAAAESATAAESAARAALEDELDRSRAAGADLAAMLTAERAAHATLTADLAHEREARVSAAAELEAARAAHAAELQATRSSLATELEAVRDAIAIELAAEQAARGAVAAELETLRAELDTSRSALTQILADLPTERAAREADREALAQLRAELAARAVPEVERPDAAPLDEAAREQAEAAATAPRRPDEESGRLIADLEAAATALREAAPAEPAPPEPTAEPTVAPPVAEPTAPEPVAEPTVSAPAAEPTAPEPVAEPTVSPPVAEPAVSPPEPSVSPPAAEPAAPPAPERPRPRIVSPRTHPPREHAVGRSARQYPPLRGALVKLAHDDPEAAARLIVGLLHAHGAALAETLDYDLTIREAGTYSISVAGKRAFVKPQQEPRSRKEAEFHLTADALTLAELLAGVDRRVGRFFGAARYRGRGSRLRALKHLPDTTLSLREAARAGARLDPGPVWKAFAYVVHPSWTKQDRWTVAQEILGDAPETWYLTSGNGDGFTVAASLPPDKQPDTTVSMTRETFDLMLRGETPPKGKLPSIRGDRRAAAQIKAWADRAQGLAGD